MFVADAAGGNIYKFTTNGVQSTFASGLSQPYALAFGAAPGQTSGAPTLIAKYSGNSLKISWPSPSTGFVLQQNSDLTAGSWTTNGFSISDDGTNKSITITSPTGNLFFRLSHP
jgi:hypothetical protein